MKYYLTLLLFVIACNPTPTTTQDAGVKYSSAPAPAVTVDDPFKNLPIDPRLPSDPSKALKSAYRSPMEIEQAGCLAADGSWACKKVPRVAKASGGAGTPITPSSWTVPVWWFDDANSSGVASDNNSCTSSGAPCLHFYEILRRLGPNPIGFTNLATTFWGMSSQADQSDPLNLTTYNVGTVAGGVNYFRTINILGTLPTPLCSGNIGSFVAKDYVGGTMPQLAIGSCLNASDLLIVNSTRGGSTAYTNKLISGNTYRISQPAFTCTIPGTAYSGSACAFNPSFQEDNAWANGDTVSVYVPKTFYASSFHQTNTFIVLDTMTIATNTFPPGVAQVASSGTASVLEIWRSVTNNFLSDSPTATLYAISSNTHGGALISGGMQSGFNDIGWTLRTGSQVGNDQMLSGRQSPPTGNTFIQSSTSSFQGNATFGSVFLDQGTPLTWGVFVMATGLYFEFFGNFDSAHNGARFWGPGRATTLGKASIAPILANPDGGAMTYSDILMGTASQPYNIGNFAPGITNLACKTTPTNPAVTDCTVPISAASLIDAGCLSSFATGSLFRPGLGSWNCNQN